MKPYNIAHNNELDSRNREKARGKISDDFEQNKKTTSSEESEEEENATPGNNRTNRS